ncbi:MAG TPA: hypothetical protein VLJ88_00270 [Propionibacteriaceae bacterium]|nr:hypothetical protein [Propionibacteriaceae bacterium]
MTIAVTLLGRTIPEMVERAVHIFEPGQTITVDDAWHQVLAVVEHGEIEIQAVFGGRVRLAAGDSFCVPACATRISNRGAGRAVVATVRRMPNEGRRR